VIIWLTSKKKLLTRSKRKLTIDDMRLPWKPIFDILRRDLFLTRRQFEYRCDPHLVERFACLTLCRSQLSWCMGYIAENVRRFFHPAAIEEMLSTFVPLINGTSLDVCLSNMVFLSLSILSLTTSFQSILASQYYMLSFLPLSHPQSYLPMLFRLWESINSYSYDERMLHFLSQLTEMHVDPSISDPQKIHTIPDDERSEHEGRPVWSRDESAEDSHWAGLYKDVGIFSEREWSFLMCKCLASMGKCWCTLKILL
jgi:proteasome activator subunit 4